MNKYTVLVTGIGAPGAAGTLECLKECDFIEKIIGVDIDPGAAGKYLTDGFYTVPRPGKDFITALFEIVRKENIAVILPQVTNELMYLALAKKEFSGKGCSVLVNDPETLELVNNKYLLLELMKKTGLSVPGYSLVRTKKDLIDTANEMGYPEKNVVAKLPVSNGMRGLRILSDSKTNYELFMYQKPDSAYVKLEDFAAYFSDDNFPELLLMEYLPGEEYTVDCLADNGEPIIVMPRSRDKIRTGITFQGTSYNESAIIESVSSIIKAMNMSFMFGFQYKRDVYGQFKMLECNPRIQGTMAFSRYCNANVIKGALELAISGKTDLSQSAIRWGVRLTRYFGGIVDHNDVFEGKF